jgi:hypothetical protein
MNVSQMKKFPVARKKRGESVTIKQGHPDHLDFCILLILKNSGILLKTTLNTGKQ